MSWEKIESRRFYDGIYEHFIDTHVCFFRADAGDEFSCLDWSEDVHVLLPDGGLASLIEIWLASI